MHWQIVSETSRSKTHGYCKRFLVFCAFLGYGVYLRGIWIDGCKVPRWLRWRGTSNFILHPDLPSQPHLISFLLDLRNLLAQMTKSLPNTELNADDVEVIDNLLKMKLKSNQVSVRKVLASTILLTQC
jgi:hypothetical protein